MATQRICSVEGCGKPFYARSWCVNHYQQEREKETFVPKLAPVGAGLAFCDAALKTETDDCILWPFGKAGNVHAVPILRAAGRDMPITRYVCIVAHGDPPFGDASCARQTCSNKKCVNPRHVRWGSRHDKRPEKTCSVDGCEARATSKGMCAKHRERVKRNGCIDLQATEMHEPLRFLERLKQAPPSDGCILWPYARSSDGYGRVRIAGRHRVPSRVVCEMVHGDPPSPTHQASHTCGRGHLGCVSPHHLTWATPKQNQQDRIKHETTCRGEKNGSAVLTPELVRSIREEFALGAVTMRSLARRHAVSETAISAIIKRRSWRHVA